jgi:hypothetical protein
MEFTQEAQEARYLYPWYLNQARIENGDFRFPIKGQESRILTIKIRFWERFKIFSDPLADGKLDLRNKIQDFKRRNIKNRDNTPLVFNLFYAHTTNFSFICKIMFAFLLNSLV